MSKAIGKAIGRPSLLPVPGFALKLLLGEAASLVLDGQRQVPDKLQAAGFTFNHPDLVPAIRHLVQNNE
jgi:NAD dependent epimerase/dehydratase family enzyme